MQPASISHAAFFTFQRSNKQHRARVIPRIPTLFVILGFFLPYPAPSAGGEPVTSLHHPFVVETVVDGLANPWGFVRLPDGRFLVTERAGKLRIVREGRLLPDAVRGIPAVYAKGQGGLLDIQLHPDFSKNGWIYLAFSKVFGKDSLTSVMRGRLAGDTLVGQETIFDPVPEEANSAGVHFGCRLVFDGAGHLFFSIGDRGGPTNPSNPAQELDNVKGKVLRVREDGGIPEDNPFVSRGGSARFLWSYGNRNIQGMTLDRKTGRLWATEHGPKGGDELNQIVKGRNYGWPVISYGINYNGTTFTEETSRPGMEAPFHHWTPSIAVSGLDIYQGSLFPKWQGNLFSGALAGQRLVRVELDPEGKVRGTEELLQNSGRIRDVRCLPDGAIYLLYDAPGKLVKLLPL